MAVRFQFSWHVWSFPFFICVSLELEMRNIKIYALASIK
jgi:hypothetical protein